MYCKNCGAWVDVNSLYCSKCGFHQGDTTQYQNNNGNHNRMVRSQEQNYSMKPQYHYSLGGYAVPDNKRVVCGVMAILLPSFGINNFILGEYKKGLLHLILLVLGIFTGGVTYLISFIWSIVEGVKIFNRTYIVEPDKWFSI